MNDLRAHVSASLTMLFAGTSWLIDTAVDILPALAAILTATFACWHYLQLGLYNREKRRAMAQQPTPEQQQVEP